MYKHLYDQFRHWFHENRGSVWFYSDPHFSDEEMKYVRKNYIGDDEQVKRINSKVGKWDTLVILGDVGDVEWVKKLRGYKVLIMGNHDSGARNYYRGHLYYEHRGENNWICDNGEDNGLFDEVYEGPLIISEKIILSHEPIPFSFMLNIHGHDHSGWESGLHNNWYWNMCAEHIDYTPVNLNKIIESGALKAIDSIHRITIDEASERAKRRK